MTAEEIKKIVDDERAEQLTALLCRHWEVATQRLDTLTQEVTDGMETCTEAELNGFRAGIIAYLLEGRQ